jgi:hypothetical protein
MITPPLLPLSHPCSLWLEQASLIPRAFDIRATIRFPPVPVRVRPSIGEELKHGWIQYVAFLVITVTLGACRVRVCHGAGRACVPYGPAGERASRWWLRAGHEATRNHMTTTSRPPPPPPPAPSVCDAQPSSCAACATRMASWKPASTWTRPAPSCTWSDEARAAVILRGQGDGTGWHDAHLAASLGHTRVLSAASTCLARGAALRVAS